jgi:hypothetical protein
MKVTIQFFIIAFALLPILNDELKAGHDPYEELKHYEYTEQYDFEYPGVYFGNRYFRGSALFPCCCRG